MFHEEYVSATPVFAAIDASGKAPAFERRVASSLSGLLSRNVADGRLFVRVDPDELLLRIDDSYY